MCYVTCVVVNVVVHLLPKVDSEQGLLLVLLLLSTNPVFWHPNRGKMHVLNAVVAMKLRVYVSRLLVATPGH